jgi:type IV pilus assembly protein PilX
MNRNNQQGSILLVSMVILLVVTLIAVDSLNTATLQAKMVNNEALRELAFQESESTIEQALDDASNFSQATASRALPIHPSYDLTTWAHSSHATIDTKIRYLNHKAPLGSSMELDSSGSALVFFNLEIRGETTLANSNVDVTVGQGFQFMGRL